MLARSPAASLGLAFLAAAAATAHAGPTILTLQPPPGGVLPAATALAADGSAAIGWARFGGVQQPVRWTVGGAAEQLAGFSGSGGFAEAASADFAVVAGTGSQGPFRWTAAGGVQPLSLHDGFANARPRGVSPDGAHTVGYAFVGSSPAQPLRWSSDGAAELLPLPTGAVGGRAQAALSGGAVIGLAEYSSGRTFARWTDGGVTLMDPLVQLPASATIEGLSEGAGVLAGVHHLGGGTYQPWRWAVGGAVQHLGLPAGSPSAHVSAVSPDGSLVLGYADAATDTAVLWLADGSAVPLADYLLAHGVDVPGWSFQRAYDCSADNASFLALATTPAGESAAVLIVIPGPTTGVALGAALLAARRRRR